MTNISKKNIKDVPCPYCRRNIDVLLMNNDEETQLLNSEYCSSEPNIEPDSTNRNIFTSYAQNFNNPYHDYLNIFLTGDITIEENHEREKLLVYLCMISSFLLIYITFIISVNNDIIKNIINYIIIWSSIWAILYTIIKSGYEVNMLGLIYITCMSLMIGYLLIIICT
jgi:hypothetical protein